MKRRNRFITTEIYPDGIFAVHKVIVDSDTHVAYYLHQEGSTASMCLLVDKDGKPLTVEDPKPAKTEDPMRVDMRDRIKRRKDDEELIKLEPVVIQKKTEKKKKTKELDIVENKDEEIIPENIQTVQWLESEKIRSEKEIQSKPKRKRIPRKRNHR